MTIEARALSLGIQPEYEGIGGNQQTPPRETLEKLLAVFGDVHRVLRPGGAVVVSFSNRCFPTKAVAIWRSLDTSGHAALVRLYLERAGFSRYSMPYFLHPRSDFALKTLPECISAQDPDRYPVTITADEYLQERLREIGLKG